MGVITSPLSGFSAGIADNTATLANGSMYDPGAGVGFRRAAGAFDPIAPGVPRESYGVSAGSIGGYVDPQLSVPPRLNAAPNGLGIFTANTATISVFLRSGGTDYLRLDMVYSFIAENVVRIAHTITNISGAAQVVRFRRLVDTDVDPGFVDDLISFPASPPGAPISAWSDNIFINGESSNPLVPIMHPVTPPYTSPLADDLGFLVDFNFGSVAAGNSVSFNIHYALNLVGQTQDQLRAQLAALGLPYVVITRAPTISANLMAYAFAASGGTGGCCPCGGGGGCCLWVPSPPAFLYATIGNGVGSCSCYNGIIVPLRFEGVLPDTWQSAPGAITPWSPPGCPSMFLSPLMQVFCFPPWALEMSDPFLGMHIPTHPSSFAQCFPLLIRFVRVPFSIPVVCDGFVDITVTL